MLSVREEGDRLEILRSGRSEGFVVRTPQGFLWESAHAQPPQQRGTEKTLAAALTRLGYKLRYTHD